jgi:hypothetical protein
MYAHVEAYVYTYYYVDNSTYSIMDMRGCQLALAEAHIPAYLSLLPVFSAGLSVKRALNSDKFHRSSMFSCAWLPNAGVAVYRYTSCCSIDELTCLAANGGNFKLT